MSCRSLIWLSVFWVIVAGVIQLAAAQPEYTVADLGTLGGDSYATSINNSGQVVGYSTTAGTSIQTHAFRTGHNAAINPATDDLGTLGGDFSYASSINNAGRVVGWSVTAAGVTHGFRTMHKAAINPGTDDLGTLGADPTFATGINAAGRVVGQSFTGGPNQHAFRTAPHAAINPKTDDLGTGIAYGINDPGQVVGVFFTLSGAGPHAFRTAHHAPINPGTDDLGTLGGIFIGSEAFGINNAGQVIGISYYGGGPNSVVHAFCTAPNAPINPATDDLGTLGASFTIASGINAEGQVVGSSEMTTGVEHAFIYRNRVMQDLNSLIPADSGWVLVAAKSINDVGQIVGYGFHNGLIRAFRLDPGARR